MRKKILLPLLAIAAALMLVPAGAFAQAAPATCQAIDLSQSAPANPACDSLPSFKASFLNRVWAFDGAVDAVDLEAHTLDMTTSGIEDLPHQLRSQDDAIVDQDTHVVYKQQTRVYDPEGHRVSQDYLDYAEEVVVRGKLVAPRKWAIDDQGQPVPTVSAKRLYIASYVDDASQSNDDTAQDEAAQSGDGSAQDPTPSDGAVTTADVRIWISIFVEIHGRQ
jgi:hypothetical protein